MPNRVLDENQRFEQLRIVPVAGRRLLRSFIDLPWSLYAGDPCWVPPLIFERKWHLSSKNPYFEHADFQAWIACRGERVVGRISAQVDQLHLQQYQDSTGFFGFLEAEDSAETFQALFEAAEDWLRKKGMRRICGPFNLSINDECGLLVDGLETPPVIMMGHALPYYSSRVEEQQFCKAKDLLAYWIQADFTPPRYLEALVARTGSRVRLRSLRSDRFQEDMAIIQDIFEDAWSQNWGFVPFTKAEFAELAKNLKILVPTDFIRIAEVDGEPAAMMVVFPNINEAIGDLNGRLLPLGWLRLLWRLKVASPKTARVPLMGVRRCYQGSKLGATLALMMISALQAPVLKRGIREAEMSWILEDNKGMCNIIESIGGVPYKRYRIYQKDLEAK